MATRSPFQSSNLALPASGSQNIDLTLDFTAATTISVDVTQEVLDEKIAFVQSIFIDNADNAFPVDLTFSGAPVSQRIRCPSSSQGWFPLSVPIGAIRVSAHCPAALVINCILANYAMPYEIWSENAGDPAGSIVAVASGVAFPLCRSLLVGTGGSADLVDALGAISASVPLQAGYNPLRVTKVTFGTAANVWALY